MFSNRENRYGGIAGKTTGDSTHKKDTWHTMNVKKAPRNQVTERLTEDVTASLAEASPLSSSIATPGQSANGPAKVQIRIHREGLLIAKCHAIGLAPSRLLVTIDPLHYPVDSRLEIEFVNNVDSHAKPVRLSATVASRSIEGIVLKVDPAPLS
jgi:hypothetical protein